MAEPQGIRPGSIYFERGQRVTVLARWATPARLPGTSWLRWTVQPRGAPRNVLIVRAGGLRAVRPFRGLRRAGADGGAR